MLFKYRLLILNAVLLTAFLGSFLGRSIESGQVIKSDFLPSLRLPFHDWKTRDVLLTQVEQTVLDPDSVLVRDYTSPEGEVAELAVIAGHRKRSIHTPDFCMTGSGYEKLWEHAYTLKLPDGKEILATRSLMQWKDRHLVTTYFFTDGDYCTPSLVRFQGTQLLKRFQAQVPLGALVRVIVWAGSSEQTADQVAERRSDEFAAAMVPAVLAALRQARVNVH